MSGRWQAATAPVLVGVVAGVLAGFMGVGSGQAQPTGAGTPPATVTISTIAGHAGPVVG